MTQEMPAHEPSARLVELKQKACESAPLERADRLPLPAIKRYPELFQPRGTSERHIQALVSAIRSRGEVDPVVVLQVGPEVVLVDGHHRIAAYEEVGVTEPIPVCFFEGSFDEAVLEAGRANSKAKLPMTTQERMDYAWRLVLLGSYSKRRIGEAASVSDGQVANMRRAKDALGEAAPEFTRWRAALRAAKQLKDHELTLDDPEAWIEMQANHYADRLTREFSTKLAHNPEVTARAFWVYFGRTLPDVVRELRTYLPEEDEEDDGDF